MSNPRFECVFYEFRSMNVFLYKLALAIQGVDIDFGFEHPIEYRIERVTRDNIKLNILNDHSTIDISGDELIFHNSCLLKTPDNCYFYTMYTWMYMADVANHIHIETYREIYNVLYNRFPQELEYMILDLLNIPHNYNWMDTLMSFTVPSQESTRSPS